MMWWYNGAWQEPSRGVCVQAGVVRAKRHGGRRCLLGRGDVGRWLEPRAALPVGRVQERRACQNGSAVHAMARGCNGRGWLKWRRQCRAGRPTRGDQSREERGLREIWKRSGLVDYRRGAEAQSFMMRVRVCTGRGKFQASRNAQLSVLGDARGRGRVAARGPRDAQQRQLAPQRAQRRAAQLRAAVDRQGAERGAPAQRLQAPIAQL